MGLAHHLHNAKNRSLGCWCPLGTSSDHHDILVIGRASLVQSKRKEARGLLRVGYAYDEQQPGSLDNISEDIKLVKPARRAEEFARDIRSLFFSSSSEDEGDDGSVIGRVTGIKRRANEGDVQGALAEIQELLVKFPNNPRVLLEFGHIEAKRGMYHCSCSQLYSFPGNSAQASALFSHAIYVLESTGNVGLDYVLALQGWASCEADSSNARVLLEESVRVAEKLEHHHRSETASVYGLHAWALIEDKLGNWSEARDLLERAAGIQPRNAVVHQARALLEARAHNYSAARYHFRLAVVSDRNDAKCWQAWALFEASRKRYKLMRRLFYRAYAADPTDLCTLQAWAHQESLIGTPKSAARARKLYQRCIRISPRNVHTWQSWALLEERSENYRAARVLYEQGIHINPSSVPCLQAYARMERRCGNVEKARLLLQAARRIDPFNAPTLMETGLLEARLGNPDMAREFFRRARRVDRQKSRVKRLRFISRKKSRKSSAQLVRPRDK